MDNDIFFMKEVLSLAKRAEGNTSPNPLVGAIIVKEGKIISSAWHRKAGSEHAEIAALKKVQNARGATLYVNLEPCFHYGRTPPCVDKVISSGIKRVVIATSDPNPLTRGKSIKKLRKSGIEVKVGVLKKQARQLNEVFFKNMNEKMPFVAAKVAQSLDGKIATVSRKSHWITSKTARTYSKTLRDKYDAVLVGARTILEDDPHLVGLKKNPVKIVISAHLSFSFKANIFKDPEKVIIITSFKNLKKTKQFKEVKFLFASENKEGIFSLRRILISLYKLGITSVFVEGGSFTLGNFFSQKLVDKIYFFLAPRIIGGERSLSSIGGEGFSNLNRTPFIKDIEIKKIGRDILISGYPQFKN